MTQPLIAFALKHSLICANFQARVRDYGEVLRSGAACDDYVARGWVFMRLQDYPRAIADSDEALRLNPASAVAFAGRGLTFREWATRQPNSSTDVFTARGLSAADKEHLQSAVADFSSAIRISPTSARIYVLCATAYMSLGSVSQAQGS